MATQSNYRALTRALKANSTDLDKDSALIALARTTARQLDELCSEEVPIDVRVKLFPPLAKQYQGQLDQLGLSWGARVKAGEEQAPSAKETTPETKGLTLLQDIRTKNRAKAG